MPFTYIGFRIYNRCNTSAHNAQRHRLASKTSDGTSEGTKYVILILLCILTSHLAENNACKYGREIQETHFGGNKPPQITYAGMSYNTLKVKSFCTVPRDLNHNPIGIFFHLKPVLEFRQRTHSFHVRFTQY